MAQKTISRREIVGAGIAFGSTVMPAWRVLAQGTPNTIPHYVAPKLSAALPDPLHEGSMVWDPTPLGYVVEERLMSGIAPIYKPITENDLNFPSAPPGTEPVADPISAIWGTSKMPRPPDPFDFSRRPILSTGPYTNRIFVYRPRDMSRFSGNVIVETIHPAGGGDVAMFGMANRFYASRGDIAVCVQHPISLPLIRYRNPNRYGGVFTTNYSQIWGMLADTARMFKEGGEASAVWQRARRVYLTGYSFTGLIVTTFAKRHHDVNRMPDRAPVFDGYIAGTGEGPMPPLDVPVMAAGNQQSSYRDEDLPIRQGFDADGPATRRRRYEIAGYQHTPLPNQETGSAIPPPRASDTERRCAYQFPVGGVHNPDLVGRPIVEGMFRNISDWVDHDVAPPRAPLIETEKGKPKLDQFGNALGGVRMPEITVPLGSYSTGNKECSLSGWEVPFMQERLRQIYGDREVYLRRYGAAADDMVTKRFILRERAERMKSDIAQSAPAF